MTQGGTLRSDIAWSTPDRIGVWGYDLTRELIGRVNLGDMGFLEITGRALPDPRADVSLREVAARVADEHRQAKRMPPGLGHPIHKPIDPRTLRLFAIARANGFGGRYIELMKLVAKRAETGAAVHGRLRRRASANTAGPAKPARRSR